MPNFRFEVTAGGQSNLIEEELASIDLASPRAVELAKAAADTALPDADHSSSHVKVYDDGPSDETDPPNEEPGVMLRLSLNPPRA